MEKVTVSSKGRIVIPKTVRDALNLSAGSRLTLEVRGHDIVLTKESSWRRLGGSGSGQDLMSAFAVFKKQEREGKDSTPD
jgi:AbrB family looped-hinge helix DNA binding protein